VGRTASETMTGREAQVMEAVWRLGEATALEVRTALPLPLHDSTVRTLLRVLEQKGYIRHEVRGKTFLYRAAIARQRAQRRVLRSVLARFFGGSAEDLVLRLIEDERLSADQLEELRRIAPSPRERGKRRASASEKGKRS
jgi:BlaI family transcriptional regulator, penicillinase repressor